MSGSSESESEKLTSVIGDEAVESLLQKFQEADFGEGVRDAWKKAVTDAVHRMQSENRTAGRYVRVAQENAHEILAGAYRHASRRGRPESIAAADIEVAMSEAAAAGAESAPGGAGPVSASAISRETHIMGGWHIWPFNAKLPEAGTVHDPGSVGRQGPAAS